jgi:uncharacterized integral membrane protein
MSQRPRDERRVSAKMIVVGVLVTLLLVVIAQNTDEARLDILMFNVTWPLWLLLTAVALVAFVAGWFSGRTRG